MQAVQNIYHGGDGAILFQRSDVSAQSDFPDEQVNRLILDCSTSKDALSSLYNMFKNNVFAVAFSITGDYHLAEDCVTETFVRLSQARHFSPKGGNGKGFIIAIARNTALEIRRRYKKECVSEVIQSYGDAGKTVEDSIFVNQLLSSLNDKQKQIVIMKCCGGLTFREIAHIMKCPETTIKSRYKRAVAILQKKAGVNVEK